MRFSHRRPTVIDDIDARSRFRPLSLFRQIASRLALFTLIFAVLHVILVVVTYTARPESLAEQLLSYEAAQIANAADQPPETYPGPPGAAHWSARYVTADSPELAADGFGGASAGRLVDWTRREQLDGGFRIAGVRSIGTDQDRRWLFMQFESRSLRPYLPVIIQEILQHAVLPLLPLVVLLLLFNIAAIRRVLAPLRRAESELDQFDPNAMSARLSEPEGPREVNALIRAVNRALDRLEKAMNVLRDFTANAAHELRTPLAIMQLSLQRLPDSAQRRELQSDIDHMTRTVGQMLDLAQADALVLDKLAIVDLGEIGREVVASLAPKAYDLNRELRFEGKGQALAQAHPEAVYRIYSNLIDNALQHAGDDGPIDVTAGPGPILSVRDFGQGIADFDKPRVFERFWRKDKRSTNGTGLGLGIVRRLTEALQGAIEVQDAEGGGACFVVRFLRADPKDRPISSEAD